MAGSNPDTAWNILPAVPGQWSAKKRCAHTFTPRAKGSKRRTGERRSGEGNGKEPDKKTRGCYLRGGLHASDRLSGVYCRAESQNSLCPGKSGGIRQPRVDPPLLADRN